MTKAEAEAVCLLSGVPSLGTLPTADRDVWIIKTRFGPIKIGTMFGPSKYERRVGLSWESTAIRWKTDYLSEGESSTETGGLFNNFSNAILCLQVFGFVGDGMGIEAIVP